MQVSYNIALNNYSSIRVGGTAQALYEIEDEADFAALMPIVEKSKDTLYIIGEGTNTLFGDGKHEHLALVKIVMNKITTKPSPIEGTLVTVDAGVLFDDFVTKVTKDGLWGVESLAGIPGTVGAAPVQNIGAYGAEVADTIDAIEVFNRETKEIETLPGRRCGFAYRSSIFNSTAQNKYIILRVRFWLVPKRRRNLPKEIVVQKKTPTTPAEVADQIRAIRMQKLPDYKTIPNCGSYFKNPLVSQSEAERLQKQFPDMPQFASGDMVKLSAGWLIERAGLKGKSFGHVAISAQHALVLTTDGKASLKELLHAEEEIVSQVHKTFNVSLAREPNMVK